MFIARNLTFIDEDPLLKTLREFSDKSTAKFIEMINNQIDTFLLKNTDKLNTLWFLCYYPPDTRLGEDFSQLVVLMPQGIRNIDRETAMRLYQHTIVRVKITCSASQKDALHR